MPTDSLYALGAFILANLAAATSGAVFKPGEWYQALSKPAWTPPNAAFPVVWTLLFIANSVSGLLVWERAGATAAVAYGAYGVSLALNAGWSAMFFGARRMNAALFDAMALFLSIAVVAALFSQYSLLAAALQLPYMAWVGVATLLNYRLLKLNRTA